MTDVNIREILNESAYTVKSIATILECSESSVYRWASGRGYPSRKLTEKIKEEIMGKGRRIQKHPSYGYATEEQIKQIMSMGMSPERDVLMRKISIQQKRKGKIE